MQLRARRDLRSCFRRWWLPKNTFAKGGYWVESYSRTVSLAQAAGIAPRTTLRAPNFSVVSFAVQPSAVSFRGSLKPEHLSKDSHDDPYGYILRDVSADSLPATSASRVSSGRQTTEDWRKSWPRSPGLETLTRTLVPVSSTTICQAGCARTQNLALMYDSWTRAAPAVRYRGWIRKIQCLRSSVTMISGHISEVGVLIFPETRRPGDNFFGLARRDRLLEDFGQFFAYFLGEAIHLLW